MDGYDQTHISWLLPLRKESFKSYAERLAEPIRKAKNPVVIGVSLGGMLASEMTTFIPQMRAIIISSVKSPEERPTLLKIGRILPLQRLLPESFIKKGTWFWGQAHKQVNKNDFYYFIKMFHDQDERFLKWAIVHIPRWKGRGVHDRIHHIHGDKDELFPFQYIKDAHLVKNGTHFMVYTRGKEVTQIIKTELSRIEQDLQ